MRCGQLISLAFKQNFDLSCNYVFILIIIRALSFCLIGVYVPVGGKKLLTFMDDLNMPAKDTFGSQPPLELIRQWIDYGFWYDRQKQTVKNVKVYTSSGLWW